MTPKEKVLKARPDAVCKKTLAGHFEVYDNEKVLGHAGTARMAWAVAWNKLPMNEPLRDPAEEE